MDPRLYKSETSGDICFLKQLLNDNPSLLYQLKPRENTALHIAGQFGHKKVVAEIYSRCRSLLTQQNLDGDTPLNVPARVGCFSIFNDLVREIHSMSQTDFRNENNGMFETLRMGNGGSNTVLHEAVRNGHIKLVEFLLTMDPKLATVENDAGESPLYLAARGGMFEILNQILKSTASSAHGGSDGQTALHAAAIEKHFGTSYFGPNALHMAIVGGQANVARKTWIVYYLMWDGRVHQSSKNKCGQAAFDIDRSIKESRITSPRTIIPDIWGRLGTRDSCLDNIKISPRAEQEEANAVQTYMQMGQTLMMVTTLITTVTFAAAFTMPGGYNNDVGPDQGQALLQSNNDFKWFIITDSIAMTCSIIASCLLFWGAVNSNKSSYVYYFTSAAALTYIALQSTAIAFETGIKAVMAHQQFAKTLELIVGTAFHVSTFLFLSQLVKTLSLPEACKFLISHLYKLSCKIKNKQ
ncbi:protein ACCELERATED CELL DEATH 6-like [Prunus avium]|uniref:Protein ACCELERATED CELL DEATH 6-like n=1 Tax=Prunus avium TaxID=42229 RepID=A0A6P5U5C9_PRUAV|nr:protein ACCELERATED CELL DEATH 6-like [Prunus avium]